MGSLLCIPRNQTQGQTSQSEISKIFKSDSSTDEVCFFDVIMIGNSLEGKDISVVTGDGHFTNQVRIRSSSKDHNMHRNSYFRICPTLRYDAQSETRKLERRASSASKESQDTHNGNVDEEEVALNKDAQDEKSKNSEKIDEFKDIMKGSHSRIRYGVQFQLMHMQSGKFLTFSEKDSYFILSVTGNEYSKFKFMPRYEFLDLDVNVVQYGNQVHLSCVPKGDSLLALHKDASHERDDLTLLTLLPESQSLKKNAQGFSFQVHKVARYDTADLSEENVTQPIRTSQLVRFWCHEKRATLRADVVAEKRSDDGTGVNRSNIAGLRPSDDGTVEGIKMNRSETLWHLEDVQEGSDVFVSWKTSYRLRHSISNRYLSVREKPGKELSVREKQGQEDKEVLFDAVLVATPDLDAEFQLVSAEQDNKCFPSISDCTFRLVSPRGENRTEEVWLHQEEVEGALRENDRRVTRRRRCLAAQIHQEREEGHHGHSQ